MILRRLISWLFEFLNHPWQNEAEMQIDPEQAVKFLARQDMISRDILGLVFDDSPEQIVVLDANTLGFISANVSATVDMQIELRQLRHLNLIEILPDLEPTRLHRLLQRVRDRSSSGVCVLLKLRKNCPDVYRLLVRFVDGPQPSFLLKAQNMTPIRAAQEQIQAAEQRLSQAIEALSDGFVYFDRDDRLVICNDQYRAIYPLSAEAMVVGATFEDILRFGLENGQYAQGIDREEDWLTERMAAHWGGEVSIEQQLSDGRWLRIEERKTSNGGHVGLRVDITALKEQQKELWNAARTDELTGLANRRGLSERLSLMAKKLQQDERIAILHLDLDRFKTINDVQGHDAGDFVLRYCSQVLNSRIPAPGIVARVGGDEFIIMMQTLLSDDAVLSFASSMVAHIRRPILFRAQNCSVDASIGVAFVNGTNENLKAALTNADIALNRSKESGPGSVALFDKSMRTKTLRENAMVQEIQAGLLNGEFAPYFQPQVDTASGQVVGFESLIRWKHPVRGMIPATEFLNIAQDAGMTEEIDNLVMDRSCYAARHLLNCGFEKTCISINLSKAQVADPNILNRLLGHMRHHEIETKHLSVELLESTLLDERAGQIIENVHALIDAGFSVELDDFGTGHAAIATLRKFNVSRIKVDRSLVQNIDSDKELQVITAAVVNLAHRLGIKALAEGVETIYEQTKLQEIGCSCMQGYFHARPMPLEDVVPWLNLRLEQPVY